MARQPGFAHQRGLIPLQYRQVSDEETGALRHRVDVRSRRLPEAAQVALDAAPEDGAPVRELADTEAPAAGSPTYTGWSAHSGEDGEGVPA